MGYRGDLGSRPAEPMVRRRAGEREPIFYDIKPVHAVFGRTNATTRGKCAHRREIALAAIEKIAVQCKDDICAIEPGDRACPHSKSALRRHASSLTQEWLINAPTHAREIFFQLSSQALACRRIRFLDKKRQAVAVIGEKLIAKFFDVGLEIFALACFPVTNKSFRAGRVVKVENRRLSESVRRATTSWMQRITLKLNRAPIDRRGDERNCSVAPRHRRGVVEKFSGNHPLYVLCERNKVQLRPATTR